MNKEDRKQDNATGRFSCDGRELREGDVVEFVTGPYSRDPYNKRTVTVVWNPLGMWSLHWSDTGINNYWIAQPEKLRIVRRA